MIFFKLKVKPDKLETNTEKTYHKSILRNTVKFNQVSPDVTNVLQEIFQKKAHIVNGVSSAVKSYATKIKVA